ncbi:PREDICTED: uncharacterized protein LOC106791280 [Polistes canadensis]|uniref:uncharacterized protein LOC106791280 n=1 Tax=Polistes canadensis TaxID=91411 RepID=UPI000718DB4B|nr:PREDICTED: uncharacterized protein LOC106791280 [Polistes canadensis]
MLKGKTMRRLAVLAAVQQVAQNHSNHIINDVNDDGKTICIESDHSNILGYNITSDIGNTGKNGHFETDLHGQVNILLGGAMLSGVIMVLIVICYCCHKNMKKHRPQEYSHYWRPEPDVHSLEVFTMDSHITCPERVAMTNPEDGTQAALPCPLTPPGPPPAYESLIFDPQSLPFSSEKKDTTTTTIDVPTNDLTINEEDASNINLETGQTKKDENPKDDRDLPTYEAALKLEADGYV